MTRLDAFDTEHRQCGDLDAGVDDVMVGIACECGASMAGAQTRLAMPVPLELDARGRRLRTAVGFALVSPANRSRPLAVRLAVEGRGPFGSPVLAAVT
jgi:hypothetical protein